MRVRMLQQPHYTRSRPMMTDPDRRKKLTLIFLNEQTARRAVGSATGSQSAFQWKDDPGKRTRLLFRSGIPLVNGLIFPE